MTTTIQVIGTIATEPKLIHPASGTPLCSFRLASDERRYDKDSQSWIDNGANWFGIVAFRSLAAHAHESFRKGDRVIVSGRLRMRSWEKEERRGVAVEIEADALGHDLRWGVSTFDKRIRARPATDGDAAEVTKQEHAEQNSSATSGDHFETPELLETGEELSGDATHIIAGHDGSVDEFETEPQDRDAEAQQTLSGLQDEDSPASIGWNAAA